MNISAFIHLFMQFDKKPEAREENLNMYLSVLYLFIFESGKIIISEIKGIECEKDSFFPCV